MSCEIRHHSLFFTHSQKNVGDIGWWLFEKKYSNMRGNMKKKKGLRKPEGFQFKRNPTYQLRK